MASGINATFRQIGIAVSVAMLGSIFASKLSGAAVAAADHYGPALNEVLLIAACVAFVAGRLALVLIRRKDFLTTARLKSPSGASSISPAALTTTSMPPKVSSASSNRRAVLEAG
jgi:prolipoprotein diacylglyceryltransferase